MIVIQEDDYGCVAACVAACVSNILGISYENALRLLGDDAKVHAKTNGFSCREIVAAINLSGKNYSYKYIKKADRKSISEDGVIVFIKRSKRYRAGHYLSRNNEIWYDPWRNFPNENRLPGVRKRLPGKPIYMIYSVGQT